MTRFIKSILSVALAAVILAPVSVFATGEEDEGLDYEYCQSVNLDEVDTYTVSFDTDGGTEIAPATAATNCSLREANKVPPTPEKANHTFFGWYRSATFESYERWNDSFGEIPQENITLYALFIPNENIINSAAIDVDSPVAGTEVTVTTDTSQGALRIIQSPIPNARPNGESYYVSNTKWVTSTGLHEEFEGVFEEGEEYRVDIMLETENNYRFAPGATFTINDAPAEIDEDAYQYSDGDWVIVSANLVATSSEEYTVEDDSGNSVSFTQEEGHNYHLNVNGFSFSMTDEELAAAGISREEYEAGKSLVSDAVKDQGTVVMYLEIEVYEIPMCVENPGDEPSPCMCVVGDHEEPCHDYLHDGPFEVKIKYTDDMAGFDTYKLIYISMTDEDGITGIEEAIELTLVDGYLVGTVPHLSGYALVGSIGAPNTGVVTNNHDSLAESIFITVIAAATLVTTGFYLIKKTANKE